ncbi:MAG: hypothetical protein FD135_920 [Comamonadaceae bacterium]|nr:MAG: hypothetical protein FD135_920 [Comamonadaceae bacterium]
MKKSHLLLLLASFGILAQAQEQPAIPMAAPVPIKTPSALATPSSAPVQKSPSAPEPVKKSAVTTKATPVLAKPSVQAVARAPLIVPQVPPPSKVTRDFYEAFMGNNFELADMLVKQGADINCSNCGGISPLSHAIRMQPNTSFDMISWVLARGGNPNIAMFNQNQDGFSAFMAFTANLSGQIAIYGGGLLPLTQRFLDAGADVKASTQTKQTVLHYLGERNNSWLFNAYVPTERRAIVIRYMDMLIAAGADINARDLEGHTPVMMAAQNICSVEVLKVYQQRRADLSIQAVDGSTVRDIIYKQAIAGNKNCNPVLAYLDSGAQAVAPISVPVLTQGVAAQLATPDKLTGNWRGVLKLSSPSDATIAVTGEVRTGGEVSLKSATGVESLGRIDTVQGDRVAMTLRSRAPQGQKFPNGSTETAEFKVNGTSKDGVLRGQYQAPYDAGEFILCKEGTVTIPECAAPAAAVNDLARAVGGLLGVLKAIAK